MGAVKGNDKNLYVCQLFCWVIKHRTS
jgi:hypothetical protein